MKFSHVGLLAPVVAALLALLPTAVLAENPNNNGHHYHYGWINHRTPPATAPPSTTGGIPQATHTTFPPAGTRSGVVGAALPATIHFVPSTSTMTPVTATSLTPPTPGHNPWLLVIVLAAIVAANVALGVLGVGRGGNFVVRRVLDPATVRS